jgi:BirA family biotin operon repressor/biotin-[acetyl-CoA-carboxylase] ligase
MADRPATNVTPRPVPLEEWPGLLNDVLSPCGLFRSVRVIRETRSTQEAARRLKLAGGEVLVAWRQTAGRGRLGRSWADTGQHGIACTFVLDASLMPIDEQLPIATAVGTAEAIESVLGRPVGLKWPNDVVVGDRKLAGILIERHDARAEIGIGINVGQRTWPSDLANRAVSLAQLGCDTDRVRVLGSLIEALDGSLRAPDAAIIDSFRRRDVLVGRVITLRSGRRTVTGEVVRLDPTRGLAVKEHGGELVWFAAATTTLDVGGD